MTAEDSLRNAFRARGHLAARIDPLRRPRAPVPELDPARHGLDEPPEGLLASLRETWCGPIGVEFVHVDDERVRDWVVERVERPAGPPPPDERRRLLRRLVDAVVFDEFLQAKYPGAKSFSLEGSESLIPLLDRALDRAAADGARGAVIGMAHRGRLSVLAHVVGKPPREIFREFEDDDPEAFFGGGDVKYHLGRRAVRRTASGRPLDVELCFNPSHLEFVGPVVAGRVRARQDRDGDLERRGTVGVVMHGDASFAGEGVVQEALNASGLDAYRTGGLLHVVVNNQIGYTTPPEEGRANRYATDVARMLPAPILHVDADDPEAVLHAVDIASDFRETFRRDVVLDLVGYRRRGHNEGDEPAFTQPRMVAAIEAHPSVHELYRDRLVERGDLGREDADALADEAREGLKRALEAAREGSEPEDEPDPSPYVGGAEVLVEDVDTGVPAERLAELLRAQTRVPDGFRLHPLARRRLEQGRAMADGERPLNWSAAESLAFATLAVEGARVRVAGQDSERGTFSQRHAALYDAESGRRHAPLAHLAPQQAPVEILNSPLSEAGALAFEYGYSLDQPDALVAWEAQFGDFANAAQVVIDQFVAAAEDKWGQLSGLVLLLPHGFEGAGPEHSSARLERFLQLSAEDNLQVVVPSTPAQYFHVLRRQVRRRWRKPLVVMTPKGLLRRPDATSPLDDLAAGRFRRVLGDPSVEGAACVMLCAGKVFYDLRARRDEDGRDDVAIVRVEQLHPFPDAELDDVLAPRDPDAPVVWVQEEPENAGAWRFLRARVPGVEPLVACRPPSASPATGSRAAHEIEQRELIDRAFAFAG